MTSARASTPRSPSRPFSGSRRLCSLADASRTAGPPSFSSNGGGPFTPGLRLSQASTKTGTADSPGLARQASGTATGGAAVDIAAVARSTDRKQGSTPAAAQQVQNTEPTRARPCPLDLQEGSGQALASMRCCQRISPLPIPSAPVGLLGSPGRSLLPRHTTPESPTQGRAFGADDAQQQLLVRFPRFLMAGDTCARGGNGSGASSVSVSPVGPTPAGMPGLARYTQSGSGTVRSVLR
jgi:hypothetical protein